jgi:ribosomal protein L7/L12
MLIMVAIGAAVFVLLMLLTARARGVKTVRPLDGVAPSAPPEPRASDAAAIADLVRAGDKIEAIKLYRKVYGVDLTEAKQAVDRLAAILKAELPPQ